VQVHPGDFLQLATVANPGDQADKLDTTLTVFDANGQKVLASIDDGYPRHGTDAWLYYRAPQTESLCVRVQDYSSWAHAAPKAFPDDPFTLTVTRLGTTADAGLEPDTEPNDTAAAAQPVELSQFAGMPGGTAFLYGGLDTSTEVDVFRVSAGFGALMLSLNFPPLGDTPVVGASTLGSTLVRASAKVTRLDGTVLGELSPPSVAPAHMPPNMDVTIAPSQDYLVWIQRPSGVAAGANDFYTTTVTTLVDVTPEKETAAGQNDTLATAEALTFSQHSATLRAGFIVGHLTPSTDVDVYSFSANAGETVELVCLAQRRGSGLRGTTFTLGTTSSTLQEETEGELADVSWMGAFGSKPPIAIGATGTYYLKVHAASQDPVNTGTYYRCSVYVHAPI
jgi:hypothetical protein